VVGRREIRKCDFDGLRAKMVEENLRKKEWSLF
jgi:hypothetical protein